MFVCLFVCLFVFLFVWDIDIANDEEVRLFYSRDAPTMRVATQIIDFKSEIVEKIATYRGWISAEKDFPVRESHFTKQSNFIDALASNSKTITLQYHTVQNDIPPDGVVDAINRNLSKQSIPFVRLVYDETGEVWGVKNPNLRIDLKFNW